jgi:D-alanyl-D-alanine carboxypeptidase
MKYKVLCLLITLAILVPIGSLRATTLSLSPDTLNYWRANGGFTRDLSLGSKGFDVNVLEKFLSLHFPQTKVYVDSLYGKSTMTAIAHYQIREKLPLTGYFSKDTRMRLQAVLLDELCNTNEENMLEDSLSYVLGREIGLPVGYAPQILSVVPNTIKTNGIICLTPETLEAFTRLNFDATQNGVGLSITSGYRRPEIQDYLKNLYVSTQGPSALTGIAEPGHSEHQLGTAIDVAVASRKYASTDDSLDITPEGQWLFENAHKYGFVLSYPKGKDLITGYKYEPWHWRYVGTEIAEIVRVSGKTPIEILKELQ